MAHPTLNQKQGTIVNVIALGLIALGMVAATLSQSDDDASGSINRGGASASASIGKIDTPRIVNAESEPGNWLAYGRTYAEQRHSPLTQINKKTIGDLELAFSVDMYTTRGLEASPIVVDGILYMTGSWSVVHAVDAKTGEEVWSYDPEVPGDWARKACCDVVNRGGAGYDGAVYVASLDGYRQRTFATFEAR